jgi:branched-chain amino acid transport system permease protein
MLSLSLNLLIGYTGILSISHAAFMGIGAYISAILGLSTGMNFFFSFIIAAVTATVLSALIAVPTLKIKGDYYIIASFGMQIIIYSIFMNWDSLTHGAVGLTGIPKPKIFGYELISKQSYFIYQ